MKFKILIAMLAVFSLIAAACGDDDESSSSGGDFGGGSVDIDGILGADLDLAGFVDTVAAAGVLVCEPGPSRAAAASRAPDFL